MIIEMQRYKKGIKQKQPDLLSQAALCFFGTKKDYFKDVLHLIIAF